MLEILGPVEGDSLQLQGICMKIDEAFLYLISSQPSPHLVIDRKSESQLEMLMMCLWFQLGVSLTWKLCKEGAKPKSSKTMEQLYALRVF